MTSRISEKFETVNFFRPVFTKPTWRHFTLLLVGSILTTGNRTLTHILRTLGPLAPHHWTTYQLKKAIREVLAIDSSECRVHGSLFSRPGWR